MMANFAVGGAVAAVVAVESLTNVDIVDCEGVIDLMMNFDVNCKDEVVIHNRSALRFPNYIICKEKRTVIVDIR